MDLVAAFSGGGGGAGGAGGNGGGAVGIVARGRVLVDGIVAANGANGSPGGAGVSNGLGGIAGYQGGAGGTPSSALTSGGFGGNGGDGGNGGFGGRGGNGGAGGTISLIGSVVRSSDPGNSAVVAAGGTGGNTGGLGRLIVGDSVGTTPLPAFGLNSVATLVDGTSIAPRMTNPYSGGIQTPLIAPDAASNASMEAVPAPSGCCPPPCWTIRASPRTSPTRRMVPRRSSRRSRLGRPASSMTGSATRYCCSSISAAPT